MNKNLATWVLATRPKTLPAAVVPVAIGTVLAWNQNSFVPAAALVCLLFAVLVQIGTNFANDYFDFLKGADTAERKGPTRAVAAGLVAPEQMWKATCAVLGTAFLLGLILIYYGGFSLIFVGVASVVCAIAYTGGPYPLGYNGLGDVFVVLFFGLIAVMFSFYVQAGFFAFETVLAGLGCGLMINNILVINNYRDLETDKKAGKRTLVVRLGRPFAWGQYVFSFFFSVLLVPIGVWAVTGVDGFALLFLMSPLGIWLGLRLKNAQSGVEFNQLLARTAQTVVLYGVLFVIGTLL